MDLSGRYIQYTKLCIKDAGDSLKNAFRLYSVQYTKLCITDAGECLKNAFRVYSTVLYM